MPIISLGIFLFIAFFFMAMVQIHLFEIAFSKLGLTPETTLLLLISTLTRSGINLRLFDLHTKESGHFVKLSEQKSYKHKVVLNSWIQVINAIPEFMRLCVQVVQKIRHEVFGSLILFEVGG